MDRIFILGALSAGSLYLLHRNRRKGEGFEGTVPDATATAFGSQAGPVKLLAHGDTFVHWDTFFFTAHLRLLKICWQIVALPWPLFPVHCEN